MSQHDQGATSAKRLSRPATFPPPKRVVPLPLIASWLLLPALWSPLGAATDYSTPYVFSTLAGASSIGSTDGPAGSARFYGPAAVAVDVAGYIFVADCVNHTIRKITPAGIVSTFAGSAGEAGSVDGPGGSARFLYPEGIAVDAAGNVFVADTGNHTIRKITPAGIVSTFAGSTGEAGSADGAGNLAQFYSPRSVVIDPSGNVLVADAYNHTIRKISPAGAVNTLAGSVGLSGSVDGIGSSARFLGPMQLTVDAAGFIYVADGAIRKVTPTGEVTTLAVGRSQSGIAVDSVGNVYLSQGDFTIGKMTPTGGLSIFAGATNQGGSRDGSGSAARFGNYSFWELGYPPPSVLSRGLGEAGGLCFDRAGNLYVADVHNNTIRKITPTAEVSTVAGLGIANSRGSIDAEADAARFGRLAAVAVGPAGELYVADPDNHVIRRVSPTGQVSTLAGTAGLHGSEDGVGGAARFHSPTGVAVDRNGTVYVADTLNYTIRRVTPAGRVSTWAGSPGVQESKDGMGLAARFKYPHDITIDPAGNVYVADQYVVRKITSVGEVSTVTGSAGISEQAADPFSPLYVETVEAVAVAPAGTLYASYQLNINTAHAVRLYGTSTVRKFGPCGNVLIVAGTADEIGSDDGPESLAGFDRLRGLAVDGTGTIYLADSANHLIRRIDPMGMVATLAGLDGAAGSADGIGRAARFETPTGIALDGAGNLYVTSGTTVRKGQLAGLPVITSQPQSLSVTAGSSVQFSVTVNAAPDPSYQWFFNGNPFTGATSRTLGFTNARASDAGDYTVVATNALGSVTSNKATLVVTTSPTPPPTPTPAQPAGGGGGAPSPWFGLALLALAALRRLTALRPA